MSATPTALPQFPCRIVELPGDRICFFYNAPTEAEAQHAFATADPLPAYLKAAGKPRGCQWICETIETEPQHPLTAQLNLPPGWGVVARPMPKRTA